MKMELIDKRLTLIEKIIDSVRPINLMKDCKLPDYLHQPVIIGIGKAAGELVLDVQKHLHLKKPSYVFTKEGHCPEDKRGYPLFCYEGGHPFCNTKSFQNGETLFKILEDVESHQDVILCLTGGASAVVEKEIPFFYPSEVQDIHRDLILNEANIIEANLIRRELGLFKNGGFAALTRAHRIFTLAVSDIPIDAPEAIGSGPTYFLETPLQKLKDVAQKYLRGNTIDHFLEYISSSERHNILQERKEILAGKMLSHRILADYETLKDKALEIAKDLRGECTYLKSFNTTMDKGVEEYMKNIREFLTHGSFCLISGGELNVKVRGTGMGGRNTEFVLRMAKRIFGDNEFKLSEDNLSRVFIASVGTDGTDGPTDAAGAWIDYNKWLEAEELGLDAGSFLKLSDSYNFFKKIETLVITGPTGTNIMDLRVVEMMPK